MLTAILAAVKTPDTFHFYGRLMPRRQRLTDDVTALINAGGTLGVVDAVLARQCYHHVLHANGDDSGVYLAIHDLAVAFNTLATNDYHFACKHLDNGWFWGWWPADPD